MKLIASKLFVSFLYSYTKILTILYTVTAGCRNDYECPSKEACINGKCQNPCSCGQGAVCEVNKDNPVCKCPYGTVGDPLYSCTGRL